MNKHQKKVLKLARYMKSIDYDGWSFRSWKILARQFLKTWNNR